MTNCERCGKEFEKGGIPRFVICETEPCDFYCSGYSACEIDLCSDCADELEKFMDMKI